jgi:hypothetical protein
MLRDGEGKGDRVVFWILRCLEKEHQDYYEELGRRQRRRKTSNTYTDIKR